jgi:hypothetical protein
MSVDIPNAFRPVPNLEEIPYREYLEDLKKHVKMNDFKMYDEKKVDAKNRLGYYYMEDNFFSDLYDVAYNNLDNLPEIKFVPRRFYDFDISSTKFKDKHVIFADELVLLFLNAFSFGAFYSSMEVPKLKGRRDINRFLVAVIDIYACRHKDYAPKNILEIITEMDNSTRFASLMSRAMYSFLLCHEIAHIALNHNDESWINEFNADALGYEIFSSAIRNRKNLKHLELFDGLARAPLALFELFDLINFFKSTILEINSVSSSHPNPLLRKAALLEQYNLGSDRDSFDLYLVISERASALKYYIHENKKIMRERVLEIHSSNK